MRSFSFGAGRPGWVSRLGPLLLISLVAGCGPEQVKVSGRVLLDGEPLPAGRLTFRPANSAQNAVTAVVDPQGNYEAVLPAGEVKVCVDNREWAPRVAQSGAPPMVLLPPEVRQKLANAGATPATAPTAPATAPANAPKPGESYKLIPSKYYGIETSGIQFKVSPADAKHDIQLTQ